MKPVFIIILLLMAQYARAGAGFLNTHIGAWYGVGVQTDGSNWDMRVSLGYTRGQVSYTSLNCGGWWRYQSNEPEYLTAIESINYGVQSCVDTGDVRLVPYGKDTLLYMWCGAEDGVSALAILARIPTRKRDYQTALLATKAALETMGHDIESISCARHIWFGV